MSDEVIEIIILFLVVYVIVGISEFAISAFFITRQTYVLAHQGEIVEWGKVFSVWLSDVMRHLFIDAIIGAVISFFIEILLKRR